MSIFHFEYNLRRRHNIMPTRFLTLTCFGDHECITIYLLPLKEHMFTELKRKPMSYENCLQIRGINSVE